MNNDKPMLTKDSQGNYQIYFTTDHLRKWEEAKLIPQHLIDRVYESLARRKKTFELSSYSTSKVLTEDDLMRVRKEIQLDIDFFNFAVENFDALLKATSQEKGLFLDVDHEQNFGVSRIETDCVCRLHELLEGMQIEQISDSNDFIGRGEIKNSKGCAIALEYALKAKNRTQAKAFIESYKKMMLTKGLRAFMAYWKLANEAGGLTFTCSISEAMNLIASEERNSYFTDKDRAEFWAITRTLAATKFVIELPKKTKSQKDPKIEWVEQPLLQVHAGEKEVGDDCPIKITATVLTEETAKRKFFPAILANRTLNLHPKDIYLSVFIQTRAAQRGNGSKEISFDWDLAFRLSGLEGSATSNPRIAKRRVTRKLEIYREKEIVKDFRADKKKVYVTPVKTKEKRPPEKGASYSAS